MPGFGLEHETELGFELGVRMKNTSNWLRFLEIQN